MIRLVLSANRELLHFLIVDKAVYYSDRKWNAWIRCLPRPEGFLAKIRDSRNKFPAYLADLFNFSEEELREYEAATTEDQLAELVLRDARGKGCRMLHRRSGELDETAKEKIKQAELLAG